MLNQTRHALENYDNQHEFERMSADILNSQGFSGVEPMAPTGGPDSGQDIRFFDGETLGTAFVTLNKSIKSKFEIDLAKLKDSEGIIALFCNSALSPTRKLDFAKSAIAKGYRIEIYDIERIRSLLDTSCKEIRRKYLHIDDEIAAKIRMAVARLMRFPDAIADDNSPKTLIERMLVDKLPRKLFELLLDYTEKDIKEVPVIGEKLLEHLLDYYAFRNEASAIENELISVVGQMVGVPFRAAWQIYVKYAIYRFAGNSMETVKSWGDFLNFGITWEDAEKVFSKLINDKSTAARTNRVFEMHSNLVQEIYSLEDLAPNSGKP
jgi:hypothetical protein